MFSDDNEIQLEIYKSPHTWKYTNLLLNNPWAKEEVSKEIIK